MKKEESKIRSEGGDVFLEIENINECSFAIWEEEDKKTSKVFIRMPLKSWKEITKNWETIKKEKK